MPEIINKTLHSFSSEDPQFPAKNLLETKVTKKWKCKEPGEKSCSVVLKLDKLRIISGIDIGNEKSAFIEVLVGNSQQDPPVFKELLLATSFMTITEARNGDRPNRVRCFPKDSPLIESVAKEKWDLVKIMCSQPFNNRIQYGLSFVTLHTPEEIKNDDDSPVKSVSVTKQLKVEDSGEKKLKFGKFTLRANSDSDSDGGKKKQSASPFDRWKSSKSESKDNKVLIKDQVKAKIEENRRRIRIIPDSSDEDKPKPKPKPNRNRTSGLVYEDEDDEPNDRLQKKMDKDREHKDKEKKTPKLMIQRDPTPLTPNSNKSKFNSFINDDAPSTSTSSSSRNKSPSRSSKPSFSSPSSSKKSPRKDKEPEKKSIPAPPKNVTYKPFHKLLEGVVFVFSGYINPERGVLRQKAIDMGARYKTDWDNNCTHLICAFSNTPKYQQIKGTGKIVTKKWIEACFSEQKRIPWRRYALDRSDRDKPESEEEIHNILLKKSPSKRKQSESGSDDDMVVVDKRKKNGGVIQKQPEDTKPALIDDPMSNDEPQSIDIKDDVEASEKMDTSMSTNVMEVSTDDELMSKSNNGSADLTQVENHIFKGKTFYLNEDLPAIDVIKLKNQINAMMGKITERASKANYVITNKGRRLPKEEDIKGEILTSLWVFECYELEALIPTTRYKPKDLS